jgi:hypothetical protein
MSGSEVQVQTQSSLKVLCRSQLLNTEDCLEQALGKLISNEKTARNMALAQQSCKIAGTRSE